MGKYIDAERLKAEIERLYYNEAEKDESILAADAYKNALDNIESFIDSSPDENNPEPYNPVYDEDYLNEKIAKATKSWEGVDVDKMLAECRGYEENPRYGEPPAEEQKPAECSEDERMVKAIEYILYENYSDAAVVEGVEIAEIVTWLEKQKENPKSADSIPPDCVSNVKYGERWHKVGDSLPDNGRLVLANDCLGNTLLARFDGEGNWEVSVYDNDDYYCRNTITKWCEIPSEKQKEIPTYEKLERVVKAARRVLNNWLDGTDCPDVSGDFGELEYAFRKYDGEEKQKEQPEVKDPFDDEQFRRGYEAGKNDAMRLPDIELIQRSWYMQGYHDREFNMEPKWTVKAEKGGPRYYENPNYGKPLEQKEQKPAEWSEEDEDMLNCCISSIEEAKENRYAYKETDGDTSYDREIAFLKALRPSTPTYNVGDKISRDGKVYTIDKVVCSDDRFEIIGRAKQELLDKTNIADSPEEMAVLDNFLFRCWQMGWLKE